MEKSPSEPERPRVEPEIIPPDRSGANWTPPYGCSQGTQRVFVGKIGPLGFALLMLVVGLFAVVLLLVLIGTALLWIPLVAVLVIAAVISRLFRS
jgi:hypothetical protein